MSYFHCDCITQPMYSLARWMIKKGCNTTDNVHQKITSQCEEQKLQDVVNKHAKITIPVVTKPIPKIQQKQEVILPPKTKIQIPLPGLRARVIQVQKSFQDQILLKSDEQKLTSKQTQSKSSNLVTSFKIHKQQLGQYYELFAAKTACLDQKFNMKGTELQIDQSPGNLSVNFMESDNLNIFIYSFSLPCSFEYYSKMINDCDLQKILDPNIQQYKTQEIVSSSAKINYVAYKKVLIVSPRDFVSLRYNVNNGIDHWDVSISIPSPQVANRVRGQIILNAARIRQNHNKNQIEIKIYSQVNMKLSVRPKLTRNQSLTEIRKYVERCIKHIQQNPDN